ncbi:hypothetical protein FXO38_19422 [Capsicum annuum]|nr:hypothetical protein FXO38_19422 [Capsicum annuum]KAF3655952.1 hypothetical protein FXO37_15667 [Capsicum annuum]
MFYANLRLSPDSREFETFVLGIKIVLNNFLFEKVFDTKFSGFVPFMNNNWPEDFKGSKYLNQFSIWTSYHSDPPILLHRSLRLSPDSRTFSSIGYILVENEWYRKESARAKNDPLKVSKSVTNPSVFLMKELEEFKTQFKDIKEGIMQLQESTAKLLDLGKNTSSDISVIRLGIEGLNKE